MHLSAWLLKQTTDDGVVAYTDPVWTRAAMAGPELDQYVMAYLPGSVYVRAHALDTHLPSQEAGVGPRGGPLPEGSVVPAHPGAEDPRSHPAIMPLARAIELERADERPARLPTGVAGIDRALSGPKDLGAIKGLAQAHLRDNILWGRFMGGALYVAFTESAAARTDALIKEAIIQLDDDLVVLFGLGSTSLDRFRAEATERGLDTKHPNFRIGLDALDLPEALSGVDVVIIDWNEHWNWLSQALVGAPGDRPWQGWPGLVGRLLDYNVNVVLGWRGI